MAKYLWLLLPEFMHKKRDQIIQIFLSNWKSSRQEFFIKKFIKKNTCILICIDAIRISVNIRDVTCTI